MQDAADLSARSTSPYYAYYQALFETADVTSFFWQPVLTAIGRTQLELVGLQARQAQAVVHWSHEIVRHSSPSDFLDANLRLLNTLMEQSVSGAPRIAAAISSATDAVAPTVPPMPIMKNRDTLVLLDRRPSGSQAERKVA